MSKAVVRHEGAERAVQMIEQARQLLEQAKTFDDIKKVRDFAATATVFIRARDAGKAAAVDASSIVLRAERRLGEWLKRQPDAKPGRKKLGSTEEPNSIPTLDDLGVDKKQSHKWQKLADVPARKFDGYINECRQKLESPTASGARRLLPKPEPKQGRAPAAEAFERPATSPDGAPSAEPTSLRGERQLNIVPEPEKWVCPECETVFETQAVTWAPDGLCPHCETDSSEERDESETDEEDEFVPELAASTATKAIDALIETWPADVSFWALLVALRAKIHHIEGLEKQQARKVV